MKNLKLIRIMNEYTQTKVQAETLIDQSILSKYENGVITPTGENLIVLSKFYNTSTDFLLDLTDEQKPYPPKAEKTDEPAAPPQNG